MHFNTVGMYFCGNSEIYLDENDSCNNFAFYSIDRHELSIVAVMGYTRMNTFFMEFTYIAVCVAILGRGFGIPLPEDIPLLMAGYLSARGLCEITLMGPLAFVSVVAADIISYAIGRRFGHHVPRLPILRHILTESRLKRAEAVYHRHGKKTICIARFMPGIRTPIFFVGGAFRVPFGMFLLLDAITALFSVSLLIGLGWLFASRIEWIQAVVQDARASLGIILACIILITIVVKHRHKHRGQPEE